MLRHKDSIGSVERMTDSAKKKYFRQKATGKEEEIDEVWRTPRHKYAKGKEQTPKEKKPKKVKKYAIQQTDTRTGESKLLDPKKPVKSDLARMMDRHDKEDVDEAARDKATHAEYKKIMTGQLNQIRKIQRLTKKAKAAKKSESEVTIVPTIPRRKPRPYKRRWVDAEEV